MNAKLGLRGTAALVLVVLAGATVWGLFTSPKGATVDLEWTLWLTFGIPFAFVAGVIWLRQVKAPGPLGTDPSMLASLALMMLHDLVPDLSAVPARNASGFAVIAGLLIGVIVINLGEAWEKPGRNSQTNPTQTGTPA